MQLNNNIVTFNNLTEFNGYLQHKNLTKKLGEGSEGVCYLSQVDNSVYKVMERSFYEYTGSEYQVDKIITTKDIKLQNFALPEELYVIRKKLIGYKTKYVTPDLFNYLNLILNYENIYKIDFSTLKKAYYQMLKEIEKLSTENIKIHDLSCNLMFTGKKLVGIDTCSYRRVTDSPLERNIEALDNALRDIFNSWIIHNPIFKTDEIVLENFRQEQDIDKYLTTVSKATKRVKRRLKI